MGFLSTVWARVRQNRARFSPWDFLHRHLPVFRLGFFRIMVVIRHADVKQVLSGPESHVSVREYGHRMKESTGPFILGKDPDPTYRKERAAAHEALGEKDAKDQERIADMALEKARKVVTDAASGSRDGRARMDVVQDMARVVPGQVVEDYLGVPDPSSQLVDWNESFAIYIFGPSVVGLELSVLRPSAKKAGEAFQEIVSEEIRRRKNHSAGPNYDDTLLGRLLESASKTGFTDEQIRQIVLGTVAGGLVATIGLFSNLMNRLLDLEAEVLEKIRRDAIWRDLGPNKTAAQTRASERRERRARVEPYVREAARFGVYPGFLYRVVPRDAQEGFVIAPGTERERTVPPGWQIWTFPAQAAFDPYAYPNPRTFDPSRPKKGDLFLGAGPHYCVGERMAYTLLYSMALPLLAQNGLQREGRLERSPWPRPYPRRLPISFEV